MEHAQPLPEFLVDRYRSWKTEGFTPRRKAFETLISDGQHPHSMVISCCDSRVHPTAFLGADEGELFMHRNIASLVPPCDPDTSHHGTPAAVEFAVTALKVSHLLVIGHSSCGGVKGCHAMCSGQAPELEEKASFVGRWVDILRPGFERLPEGGDEATRLRALEQGAVVLSLEHLMTYPFVRAAVEGGTLSLHGAWIDIAAGALHHYDPQTGTFIAL